MLAAKERGGTYGIGAATIAGVLEFGVASPHRGRAVNRRRRRGQRAGVVRPQRGDRGRPLCPADTAFPPRAARDDGAARGGGGSRRRDELAHNETVHYRCVARWSSLRSTLCRAASWRESCRRLGGVCCLWSRPLCTRLSAPASLQPPRTTPSAECLFTARLHSSPAHSSLAHSSLVHGSLVQFTARRFTARHSHAGPAHRCRPPRGEGGQGRGRRDVVVVPRCSRGAAEVQPRCSRGTSEGR